MKKETPILFSSAMVQAILEGRKTQTRRENKSIPRHAIHGREIMDWPLSGIYQLEGEWKCQIQTKVDDYRTLNLKCPYGKPGDLLWVREPHFRFGVWVRNGLTKTGRQKWKFEPSNETVYYEDNPPASYYKSRQAWLNHGNSKFMPAFYRRLARFMTKSVARIWLEVTDIRVERLQDISEQDAKAEGLKILKETPETTFYEAYSGAALSGGFTKAKIAFENLWETINGENSWGENPWVWVVSFKVVSKTGKPK